MLESKLTFNIICITTLLSFIVILLGATTRLKDAGLGCPDWPGCYGKFVVQQQSTIVFSKQTINANKAWTEMIHRYAAALLILLSFAVSALILQKRKLPHQPVNIALLLLILLFFQGLLGKWTVTLRLQPLIVILHLLGGFSLLSLLWILLLHLGPFFNTPLKHPEKKLRCWSIIGLALIIVQITLGGWTSSNYAAFVCPDFPRCQGEWWPPNMSFIEGFHLLLDSNKNFEGGLLTNSARTAIQMCHRIGALITSLYLIFLSWKLRKINHKTLRVISFLLVIFLALQISLGIMNVIWLLPLPIAIAHNGIAMLLLLLLITLNSYLSPTLLKYRYERYRASRI